MFNLHIVLAAPLLVAVVSQPVFANDEFTTDDITACTPIGKIAVRMTELQDKGLKREFIESGMHGELGEELSLWVKPISNIVFSSQQETSEKIIKQAIRYCLHTMRKHKNRPSTLYVEA